MPKTVVEGSEQNCRHSSWLTQAGSAQHRNSAMGHSGHRAVGARTAKLQSEFSFLSPEYEHSWVSIFTTGKTNNQNSHTHAKTKKRLPRLEITSTDHIFWMPLGDYHRRRKWTQSTYQKQVWITRDNVVILSRTTGKMTSHRYYFYRLKAFGNSLKSPMFVPMFGST